MLLRLVYAELIVQLGWGSHDVQWWFVVVWLSVMLCHYRITTLYGAQCCQRPSHITDCRCYQSNVVQGTTTWATGGALYSPYQPHHIVLGLNLNIGVTLQVWPELLVLLCEGEADAQPWDQDRQRQPGQATGAQQDATGQQQATAGWQLLVKEYSRQEVLRKVVQVGLVGRREVLLASA